MNIIFIWYGLIEPVSRWREMCLKRAVEVYPNANFSCITTLKYFYGMNIIDARKVISEMEAGGYYHDIHNFMAMSDEMRFWWLERNEYTLYMDTDTYCKTPMLPGFRAGKAGIEAIWSGRETKPFADILDMRKMGSLFVHLSGSLEAEDMREHFEHKPRWSKQYRQNNLFRKYE